MKYIALKQLFKDIIGIQQIVANIQENDCGQMNEEENFYIGHSTKEEEFDMKIACHHLNIAQTMLYRIYHNNTLDD